MKREDIAKRRTAFRDQRAVAIELLYRYSALKQREIGQRRGQIDYSAVSRENIEGILDQR